MGKHVENLLGSYGLGLPKLPLIRPVVGPETLFVKYERAMNHMGNEGPSVSLDRDTKD